MAYDKDIERQINLALEAMPEELNGLIGRKNMFGGLAYLYSGKMAFGIVKQELVVRILVLQNAENTSNRGRTANGFYREADEGICVCIPCPAPFC